MMIKLFTLLALSGECLGQANGSAVGMTTEQQKILAQLLGPGVSSLSNGMYQIPVSRGQASVSQGSISQGNISQGSISQGNISQGSISQGSISQGSISQGSISQGNISQGSISQGVNMARPSTNVQLQDTSLVFTHTGSQPPNTSNLTQAQIRNLLLGLPVDRAQISVAPNQSSVSQNQNSLADVVASWKGSSQNIAQSFGNGLAVGTIIPGKASSSSASLGSRMNSLQRQNLLSLLGDPSTAISSPPPQVKDHRLRLFLEAKAKGEIPNSNIFQTKASSSAQTQTKEQAELLKLIELMRQPSNSPSPGQMPYISDSSSSTSTVISGSPSSTSVTSSFPPASSVSSGLSSTSNVSSGSQTLSGFPPASGLPPGFPNISTIPSSSAIPSGSMSVSTVSSSSGIPSGFPAVSGIPSGMGGFSQTGSVTETTKFSSTENPSSGSFGSGVQTSSSTTSQEDLTKLLGPQNSASGNGSSQTLSVTSISSSPVPIPKSESSSSAFSSQSVQQTPMINSSGSTIGQTSSVDMASELARLQSAGVNIDFSVFQKLFTPTSVPVPSPTKL